MACDEQRGAGEVVTLRFDKCFSIIEAVAIVRLELANPRKQVVLKKELDFRYGSERVKPTKEKRNEKIH
jgi:hypothetical protein